MTFFARYSHLFLDEVGVQNVGNMVRATVAMDAPPMVSGTRLIQGISPR